MDDVDDLNYRFGPLITTYSVISDMLRERDQLQRPKAHVLAIFLAGKN